MIGAHASHSSKRSFSAVRAVLVLLPESVCQPRRMKSFHDTSFKTRWLDSVNLWHYWLQSTFPIRYPTNDDSTIAELTTAYYVQMVLNVPFHLGRFEMPCSQTNAGPSNCCCGEEQPVGTACWVAICMNLMPRIYQLCHYAVWMRTDARAGWEKL